MQLSKHTRTLSYKQTEVCTCASYRGGNQGRRTARRKQGRGWDRSRGRDRTRERGGGENGDVNGDECGNGASTRTKVEANEGTQMGADGSGKGAGRQRRRKQRWRPVEKHRMKTGTGTGTETRALAEVRAETSMKTGTGTRTGSRRAEERRMGARNRTRLVGAISPFHSVRVIISADRGWCLRAPDSSVRKARCLYTHIEPKG